MLGHFVIVSVQLERVETCQYEYRRYYRSVQCILVHVGVAGRAPVSVGTEELICSIDYTT